MALWDRLRDKLERSPAHPLAEERNGPADIEVRVAMAVLLLEAAYGDEDYVWAEHRAILRALEEDFGITREEARELLASAGEVRPPVLRLADLTDVLRTRLDTAQRREVVRRLWKVVAADATLAEWEAVFVDHVARALGLGDSDLADLRDEAGAQGLKRR